MALSPTLDPVNVTRYRAKDPRAGTVQPDPELDSLAAALGAAQTAAAEIEKLASAINSDASRPAAENAIRLRSAAGAVGTRGAGVLDAAVARTRAEIERSTANTWSPPAARNAIEESRAAELRGILRAMAPKDRAKEIADRMATGDDAFLAAILSADALTTGMGTAEIESIRDRWRRKTYPNEVDRIARLQKAVEAAHRGGLALVEIVTRHTDSQATLLADAAAQRAAEAIAAAGNRA